MNGFIFREGILQAADINPTVPGPTTLDLTNPVTEHVTPTGAAATKEIATGAVKKQYSSPLFFVAAVAIVLFAISYLQRKK